MIDVDRQQLDGLRARADMVMADVVGLAENRGRAIYRTGDRARSVVCLTQHMSAGERYALKDADRYACPTCGWLLKDRSLV